MSVTAIARRYAEAMADVAFAQNQVGVIDEELRVFAGMMKSSRELYNVFASPVLSRDSKNRVLEALIERTRPCAMTANLLRTMLGNNRVQYIEAVYEQFRREVNERSGTVRAEVTTAGPIEPAQRDLLGRNLEQLTGKHVQLEFHTDPSMIGGVITRIGSIVYDGSVRTQLQGIKEKMKQEV